MDPKPGYQSTEFYLVTFVNLVTALLAAGVFPDTSAVAKVGAFILSALATLGYTYGRSYVKAASVKSAALVDAARLGAAAANPPTASLNFPTSSSAR